MGTDLIAIYKFDACSPKVSAGGMAAYFAAHLPALPQAWASSTQFPYDASLLQRCVSESCWSVTSEVPHVFGTFERAHGGQGAVIYQVRYAVSRSPSTCAQNPGAGAYIFFVPNLGLGPQVPLAPMSRAGEDYAPHLHAQMVCSPGTASSITTFMDNEFPTTLVVSWSVTDPASRMQWYIGYR